MVGGESEMSNFEADDQDDYDDGHECDWIHCCGDHDTCTVDNCPAQRQCECEV